MSKVYTIDDVMKMKKELQEVHASLSVYMSVELSPEAKSEIVVLQDRLEFRVLQYEGELLKEKISIYKESLKLAKNGAKKINILV